MLMMSLRAPGVTVSPIRLATGGSYFCQEFFDDARIPVDHLVGEENDGWRVAMRLLFHERNVVGGNSFNDPPYAGSGEESEDDLITLARLVGKDQDPYTRQLLAEALVLRRLAASAVDRVNAQLRAGTMSSSGPALLKLMTSLSQYRSREIAIEIGGTRVALAGIDDAAGIHGLRWLGARTRTLAGGSNEILRNQISERVLGLPPEPNPDKNIPFSQVLARRFHPDRAPRASG
jgi:alkylation response protein AidB-like acyl-CoA dehydrogenase